MPIVPLFGRGVKSKSSNVIAQRRINLYAEQPSDDDKSGMVFYSRPGLYPKLFTNNADGYGGGPIRGVIVAQRVVSPGTPAQQTIEMVFGAIGRNAIVSNGNPDRFLVASDAFVTSSGPMVYADNGAQVLAVDGRSAYVAAYSIGGVTQTDIASLGVTDFPYGATSICSVASRFVVNDPSNKGRFYWSDPLDYSSWPGLNFATAESFPDALSCVYAHRGELILFGSQSMEFWAPTADGFARIGGSGNAWGLAAQDTICEVDGSLFFLARNAGSDAKVVAVNGYQAQPISDPDVEDDINRNLVSVSACVIRKAGHTFYVLRLGSKTWAFDVTSGQWDEWKTGDENFVGRYSFFAYGRQSVTDAETAEVYGVSPDAYQDGDVPMVRELTSRHVFHDLDRLSVYELRLDCEVGVGLQPVTQGSDPQIMLQVSRDGGHTFGDELWTSLGKLGEFLREVFWTRLGRSRDFVFRFRVTDPVKVVVIGASLRIG